MSAWEAAASDLVKITKSIMNIVNCLTAVGGSMPERAKRMLESLAALWAEKRGENRLPRRADLPVSELKPWLGSLALFEFRPEAGLVFRLCGTGLLPRFGGEMTGKPLESLAPEMAAALRREVEAAIREGRPRHVRAMVGSQVFHELYLPLDGEDGELVLFASYGEAE
jgi:hypothetical protein